ncbi:zinc metalloprotease [Bacillus safensis]|uniref:metalloprotease family protein n=1 Tax=Bacillus safensis TaxID=561879 RepID=UPI0022804343|nr:metalloprotease family protein [Bacillus safensis]MCY7675678.1 metalloprotease family protein [Bacillus safensis]MCY7697752.1 metalloprotease family protein [Bacillus safensis]MEC3625839.1 metalloprotease family protein [Bacillus safensis]
MIELVCSFLAVVVIHELGHMLMIMLCNKIEKRPLFDFVITIDWKHVAVVHETFARPSFNMMVALAGPLFPVLCSIVLFMIWKHPVSHQLLFFSLLNTVMLHPACPDGKNITASLKEMKERKR